jgi:hypothetical protein
MRPASKLFSVVLLTLLYSVWVVCPVGAHLFRAAQTSAAADAGGDCHGKQPPAPKQTCGLNPSEYLPSPAAKLSIDDLAVQLFAFGPNYSSMDFGSPLLAPVRFSLVLDPPLLLLNRKLRI